MTVRDVDQGYKALMQSVSALQKAKVAVGIFEADGAADAGNGQTVIEVAIINEFGGGNVPARSFIRAWVDENQDRIREALFRLVKGAVERNEDPKVALERFGLWMQGEIQARIARGIDPPNAPSTIVKKGSSKPLIDKGQLRSSITYAVDLGTGELKPAKSEATSIRESRTSEKPAQKKAKKLAR